MPDPILRDFITSLFEQRYAELANRLSTGALSLADFQISMRQEMRDNFALQLRAGAGEAGLTVDDYLKLGPQLQSQYKFLEAFAHDITAGTVSGDAVAGRAMLYARPSQQMYWRQKLGDIVLPAYPGEGTFCRCGCNWRTEPHDDGSVDAFWERSLEDSCDICIQREHDWNPYHIPGEAAA